jgi:hypothetical protein
MPTPSYLQRFASTSGIYIGPTQGKSSPKNSRRACLCLNSNTYSRKCCNGALLEQGIGVTQVPYVLDGEFNAAFNGGFDVLTMDV